MYLLCFKAVYLLFCRRRFRPKAVYLLCFKAVYLLCFAEGDSGLKLCIYCVLQKEIQA